MLENRRTDFDQSLYCEALLVRAAVLRYKGEKSKSVIENREAIIERSFQNSYAVRTFHNLFSVVPTIIRFLGKSYCEQLGSEINHVVGRYDLPIKHSLYSLCTKNS
jgi:hypothetical protein